MSRSRRRRLLGLLCVLLIAAWAAGPALLGGALAWLDVGTEPERTDYVLVLGGDTATRPFVAASLVNLKLGRAVLVPRMIRLPGREEANIPYGEELSREVLVRRGVPRDRVLIIGQPCAHTEAEARALREWLEETPGARVAVVTSGYHTRRARWIFRTILGPSAEQVSFVSAPWDSFPAERWWRSEIGLVVVLGEYLKLAFYVLYYGNGVYWIAGLVGFSTAIWLGCRVAKRVKPAHCAEACAVL
jgi:uncharacterized SAM-binding protein YcdF (DUF218 family)